MPENVGVEVREGVCWITLKREDKYNALNTPMYVALCSALDQAESDDDVILTVITGSGKYYSAGSDFTPKELAAIVDAPKSLDAYIPHKCWADRMIKHSKPLIALVNGPAVGIAVTTLAVCDAVFASDTATFLTPFTELGLVPEAGSSSSFVQAMGHTKAANMLLFGEKITAEEAYIAGLVTKVFPQKTFHKETEEIIGKYSKLGKQSLLVSKRLLRPEALIDHLLTVNKKEFDHVMAMWNSEETMERLMKKFDKSKL